MCRFRAAAAVITLGLCVRPCLAVAEESAHEGQAAVEPTEPTHENHEDTAQEGTVHEGSGHEGGHHHHANHVAVFAGATTLTGAEGRTAATVGLDYARRLPFAGGLFSVGAIVDLALFDDKSLVVAPALFVHPYGGLTLLVAPGLEHEGEENTFVLRGGAAWFFHAGSLSLGPSVAVDWTRHATSLVYGLSAGVGF